MNPVAARTVRLTAGLALLLALAACGQPESPGGRDESPETTTEPTMTHPPTTPPPGTPGPTGPSSADDTVAQAVRDLAGRLGVTEDDVEVARAAAVTWRDGSLGCPAPGMAYTQALTEGMLIELSAQGRTYSYHSGPGREPFLCERPQPPLRSGT
ncbi:hypothetical protein [Georgenia wangjunii]|uniref:hypothetical protein n=1 Tax=Georgenia wangjunii TaxID=3117730 RepID=UPI002F2610FE